MREGRLAISAWSGAKPMAGLWSAQTALRHVRSVARQDEIPVYLKNRQWEELSALVEFANKDAPESLAHTDPALYRTLRHQITQYRLRGWSCLSLRRLRELAGEINAA